MPNVLDAEPIRAFVRRAGAKIADEKIAAQFERIAFKRLLEDPLNFRPARPAELESAPDWARAAHARGEEISVFKLSRGAALRIHGVARRLAHTCKLAAYDCADRPRDATIIAAAREFLDKFERAKFEVAARKALFFARLYATWIDDGDNDPLCPAQIVLSGSGRVWRRVTTMAELRAVGREFCNCLARASSGSAYGGHLRRSQAQFWVLRDSEAAGLIVAMASAPHAVVFSEVRGPRNAHVSADNTDLRRLASAIGIYPPTPPPPPASALFLVASHRRAS